MTSDPASEALSVAERVADACARHGLRAVLIGATAMAVHGYARATQDVDLGIRGASLATLRAIAEELRSEGLNLELREPDAADPLGGVLRIEVTEELQVDVVNFINPWTGAGRRLAEASLDAPALPLSGWRLSVVDLIPLVLLKLAAGGRFDLLDVAELISRHPEIDRGSLRARCAELRLDRRLDRVLAELDAPPDEEPVP